MALVMSFADWVSQYGTISLTNSGGTAPTVASGYSLASLKTRQLGDICRINGSTATTIIRIDLSETTDTAMMCGLVALESEEAYTLTFKTYNTSTLRTESDPVIIVGQTLSNWFSTQCDLHATPAGSINRLEIWLAPFSGLAHTLDIGRIWYGPAFQSVHSTGNAWDTGPEDTGGVSLSRSGAAYPRVGVISRSVTVPVPRLEAAEIFGGLAPGSVGAKSTVTLESGVHAVGKTNELLAFQENTTNPMRPLYGHFIDMPRFASIGGNNYETTLNLREER